MNMQMMKDASYKEFFVQMIGSFRNRSHASFEETVVLPLAKRLLLDPVGTGGPIELGHRIDRLPRIL